MFRSLCSLLRVPLFLAALFGWGGQGLLRAEHPGAVIYRNQCVECHGENGEGVPDEYDEPLVGDRTLESLTGRIERTMPEDDEDACVGEDAAAVAAYIYDAFYSPEAQARLNPVTTDLVRMTEPQYRAAVADLIGHFRGGSNGDFGEKRGLEGDYEGVALEDPGKVVNAGQRDEREKIEYEQVDARIDFDFGEGSPQDDKMRPEEFEIRWRGSLIAEETGLYEIVVRTENGARLQLNSNERRGGYLVDGWVTAGDAVRDLSASIFLLGGRAYPLQLEWFKYRDETASVELLWKTPSGVLEVIPERNLSPERQPEVMVVATPFPADDASYGYERGIGLSKEWDVATTHAAVEVLAHVDEHVEDLADLDDEEDGASDRAEKLKAFCAEFAEVAFRRPLSEDERERFVERQFREADDPEKALKRSVLFVLKSPRFLYPELPADGRGAPDQFTVASRLALALWDSIPDRDLREMAADGRLGSRDAVVGAAREMLDDPRAKLKLRGFFHHWLEMERAGNIAKDSGLFPDFDDAVLADLHTSLDLFLDEVVWGEGGGDYRQLLLADYLFLNERLGAIYGREVEGPGFQRVAFDPGERSGVITHPFLLTAFAYNTNSSPIHRGVFLTRNIVGQTLKPPPEAVEFDDGRFDPTLTMREKVTELTRSRACMACHATINPLGFSLENYDAIGRWRTEDNDKPVDPISDFLTAAGETIRLQGARDVAEHAAQSESAQAAFVRHLFHHIVKQPINAYGSHALEELHLGFVDSGFNIRDLLVQIAALAADRGTVEQPGNVALTR